MAPFPETEIMTIKRLEVALRKMDLKLLKDGAYKLHEKFHSGHIFEYTDMLKDIYSNVYKNDEIPSDIKDILSPTIVDILEKQGLSVSSMTSPYEAMNQNRVSSLTSLSYNADEKPHKIDAFEAFGSKGVNQNQNQIQSQTQPIQTSSVLQAQPQVQVQPQNQPQAQVPTPTTIKPFNEFKVEENFEQNVNQNINQNEETVSNQPQQNLQNEPQNEIQEVNKEIEQIETKKKKVCVFYCQENSNEKIKNIIKYKNLINKTKTSSASLEEFIDLISEINLQANTNVSELKNLLEQLKNNNVPTNLITNSQSSNLIELAEQNDISYNIFNYSDDVNLNIMPLFGLSNLYKCPECKQEYLYKNNDVAPLAIQCPKCKKAMYPDFYYSNNDSSEINMDYYNYSMIALAESDVWLIIKPSCEDKTLINLLRSALRISNEVKEIFILDKDINIRETFKNYFNSIKEEIKINTQMTALEDFFRAI